jgi:hypothetical protein
MAADAPLENAPGLDTTAYEIVVVDDAVTRA